MIEFIERPDVRAKLQKAAEEGIPPVMAISGDVIAAFQPATFADPMNKRRLGLLVAATLDQLGYEPARSNVRIKNPVFSSGSTYRRKLASPQGAADDFITRLGTILTEEDARRLIDGLLDRFPQLQSRLRR